MNRFWILVCLLVLPASGATTRTCAGSQAVGSFRLTVQPAKGGLALPVRDLSTIPPGGKLRYDPAGVVEVNTKAQVAVILAPKEDSPAKDLMVLGPEPADEPASWDIPKKIDLVALIYGPQGLSVKKLKSLVDKNQEILAELADYADQTSQVEGLVQTLQASERSGNDLQAALSGFSAQYNVAIPKLDPHAPTDQQAGLLLRALMPSVSTYDPLSPRTQVMQQSAGLAAAVASLFFGSPVGLAAGGASLFQNMRTLMFPDTEFRSAIGQAAPSEAMALCTKIQPAKSRTRLAYLWAHRMPNLVEPSLTLIGDAHVPAGSKSLLGLKSAENAGAKSLAHLREWQLVAETGKESFPATVKPTADSKSLELDLTRSKAAAGEYRLTAKWDWASFQVMGNVFVHPYAKLDAVKLTPESCDRLVEGSGRVTVRLTGADFQFIEKVAVEKADRRQKSPQDLPFTLPKGKRGGPQDWMEAELDMSTLGHGDYRLLLTQSDGLTHELPVTILPPHPKIAHLPLRANLGDKHQKIRMEGSGLDRIEKLSSDAAEVKLGSAEGGGTRRDIEVQLNAGARKGQMAALAMKIQGIHRPLTVSGGLEIAGPRPKIAGVRKSFPKEGLVELRQDEIPSGTTVSFALSVENLDLSPVDSGRAGAPISVEVFCSEEARQRNRLLLTPGENAGGARLNVTGQGLLFLSLEPGAVGQSGCDLTASVTTRAAGTSDPFPLGRVVRVPRVEQFVLTDEKLNKDIYVGTLTGQDLDMVEKAGWDAGSGIPVESIPTPVGEQGKQVLKIGLPWPAPAPHAPVYVWLRGENQGRATGVKY